MGLEWRRFMEIKAEVTGTLRQWFYDVGDIVEAGEPLAEIETHSLSVELESPVAGRVTEMRVLNGDTVTAGMVLARIEPVSPSISDLLDAPAQKQKRKVSPVFRAVPPTRRVLSLYVTVVAVLGCVIGLALLLMPLNVVMVDVEGETSPVLVGTPAGPIPTLTALFDPGMWDWSQPLQLVEAVNNWPAGSPVLLRGMLTDPVTGGRVYEVISAATGEAFVVREDMIVPSDLPTPQPTMMFNEQYWSWFYPLILSQTVADFPAGTRVKLINANYIEGQWQLRVVTENGFSLDVRESQLNYPPDTPPNFHQLPDVKLINYINLDGYPLETTEQVDHIPPNTLVRALNFQQGFGEWVYRVVMEGDERVATARESQLRVNEH
jgi:hypothetical protein